MPLPAFINPTNIGLAISAANTAKSLFSGGGGGGDTPDYNTLLQQIRQRASNYGGAAQRQNEAIVKQNLAGSSKAQTTNVLGEQLNRDIGSLFQSLSQAEVQALRMLFGAKQQQEYLKAQSNRDLLGTLSGLGEALGQLQAGGVKNGKTQTKQTGNTGNVDLGQLLDVLSKLPSSISTTG